MRLRASFFVDLLLVFTLTAIRAAAAPAGSPTEYSKHFSALSKLSVAVAQAMPPEQYAFRPDPGSMSFGELMSHIASTHYTFCAGLKDSTAPSMLQQLTENLRGVRDASSAHRFCSLIRFLYQYCPLEQSFPRFFSLHLDKS
jgi:hypothetical protein